MTTPIILPPTRHTRGDTWNGWRFGPCVILATGAPMPHSLAEVHIHYRDKDGALGYALSSVPAVGVGEITIVDAAAWSVLIPPQPLPLPAGIWAWDCETVDASGVVRTFYESVLTVKQDKTVT